MAKLLDDDTPITNDDDDMTKQKDMRQEVRDQLGLDEQLDDELM